MFATRGRGPHATPATPTLSAITYVIIKLVPWRPIRKRYTVCKEFSRSPIGLFCAPQELVERGVSFES